MEIDKKTYRKISRSVGDYTPSEIAVIRDSVAKSANANELVYFLNVAKSVSLNPFVKEIWCYKDKKNNLLVFAGRDGFLSSAQRNARFDGIRSSEVRVNDEFSMDIANNKIEHKFNQKDDRGEISGAYAIAFRKGGEPTVEWVDFKTYRKKFPGPWQTHPADMIKKVAETHALKKAFGLSGLQPEYDFEVKGGVANAIDTEIQEVETKRRRFSDNEFEQFLQQGDDYIERHREKIQLTGEQEKKLNIRLSGDGK